jgi:SAM-dependent methyltransferase
VGRLAAELDKRNVPDVEYLGGDYSERAVAMARVLNPGHHFQVVDITAGTEFADNFFDKLISIETLEHIPPPKLPQVVDELYRVMKPGGRGLVTVPHRNRPKDRKHYQHFDVDSLSDTLGKRFEIVRMYGFHSAGWWRNVPLRILTGLYYALYPCTKLGLNAVPKGINHLAYGYFRNSVRQCGPDQGLSLLCEIRKAP